MKNKSTMWILASLLMGIISGLVFHWLLPVDVRDSLVAVFDTVTHMFLNLIKMIIAPLIFATLVSGIAGAAKSAGVGKLFGRSMIWRQDTAVAVHAPARWRRLHVVPVQRVPQPLSGDVALELPHVLRLRAD